MSRWSSRAGWLTAAVLALFLVAAFARDTFGGPLDPGGPPAPTMQQLDEIPGSWHRILDSTNGDQNGCNSTRFECVLFYVAGCPDFCHFEYGGVLDHETGLVWERTPSSATDGWVTAAGNCAASAVGGRRGWRLPTLEEAFTILDPVNGNLLPAGHPFLNVVQEDRFWTATTFYDLPGYLWTFINGADGNSGVLVAAGEFPFRQWCVRGHGGYDGK